MGSLFVRDIAQRLAVTEHAVLSWIKAGELKAINVSRRPGAKRPTWRITQEALEAFEARRTPTLTLPRVSRRTRSTGVIECY
jgi:hypothetical protein